MRIMWAVDYDENFERINKTLENNSIKQVKPLPSIILSDNSELWEFKTFNKFLSWISYKS